METKASLVVMSHLSDAQELMVRSSNIEANRRINFAKYIMFKTNYDLNQEIDADALWKDFQKESFFKSNSGRE